MRKLHFLETLKERIAIEHLAQLANNITMKFLLALMASALPVLAADKKGVETIQAGNFWFREPLMMSVNYAQSQENSALFALGITHSNSRMVPEVGLAESSALLINCRSGEFSAAFAYETDFEKTAKAITRNFCDAHKKTFKHSLWKDW